MMTAIQCAREWFPRDVAGSPAAGFSTVAGEIAIPQVQP